ncbi:MAG: hypothetical protein AWU59_838 [Methanolobus sp. T82-4]|nr:MAG: hypothetical protein AWU59_838 [Methanolobus sp. T82-4]
MTFDSCEDNRDKKMAEIVDRIRNCNLGCYRHEYTASLRTRGNRVISVEELKNGKPLVDDWRGQNILFISQAPSKQAWADNELSSRDNSFLVNLLFPKVYPHDDSPVEKWQKSVFWLHTSNCYPGKANGEGDNAPDPEDCAAVYFDEVINAMKPECIVLMGKYATQHFTKSHRLSLSTKRTKPPLKDILKYQHECQRPLLITSEDGTCLYETIVLKHARNKSISTSEKFAIGLAIKALKNNGKTGLVKSILPSIDTKGTPLRHTWLKEITEVLETLGGDAKNNAIYREIENRGNMELKPTWKQIVTKTIGLHSSDTGSYKEGNPDIFYMIETGHWGLRNFQN